MEGYGSTADFQRPFFHPKRVLIMGVAMLKNLELCDDEESRGRNKGFSEMRKCST